MSEVVRYEVIRGVAWLIINRPEARNAINAAARAAIFRLARAAEADSNVKVLVLTGSGDTAFCAGGDLKEMAAVGRQAPGPNLFPTFGTNIKLTKPAIAAVNGLAYAGGFLLAQMCDMCVAARSATFAVTEARVGRGMPWAVPLSTIIPPRIAFELLATGQPISAQRAYEIGLANRVVPLEKLRETVQQTAEAIASNAPLTVAAAKRTVWLLYEDHLSVAYEAAESLWEPVYRSRDAQEGPRAFAEKRKPAWVGR